LYLDALQDGGTVYAAYSASAGVGVRQDRPKGYIPDHSSGPGIPPTPCLSDSTSQIHTVHMSSIWTLHCTVCLLKVTKPEVQFL